MKHRIKGRDLFHQPVGQLLTCADGKRRNVIDRLLRIKLGALPARHVQNIDKMAAQVEKPEFEHRKQAARAGPDNDDIGLDGGLVLLGHGQNRTLSRVNEWSLGKVTMMVRLGKGQRPAGRQTRPAEPRLSRSRRFVSTCCIAGGASASDRRHCAAWSATMRT